MTDEEEQMTSLRAALAAEGLIDPSEAAHLRSRRGGRRGSRRGGHGKPKKWKKNWWKPSKSSSGPSDSASSSSDSKSSSSDSGSFSDDGSGEVIG